MPDISMCLGGSCEQKDTCYRYTATPNPHRQAYFASPPVEEGFKCVFYVKDEHANTSNKPV